MYGCFSWGKASSHSTALPRFFSCLVFLPLWTVFSCFHTTSYEAYSFTTDGYGIFNVSTNLGVCFTHEVLKLKGKLEGHNRKETYWLHYTCAEGPRDWSISTGYNLQAPFFMFVCHFQWQIASWKKPNTPLGTAASPRSSITLLSYNVTMSGKVSRKLLRQPAILRTRHNSKHNRIVSFLLNKLIHQSIAVVLWHKFNQNVKDLKR